MAGAGVLALLVTLARRGGVWTGGDVGTHGLTRAVTCSADRLPLNAALGVRHARRGACCCSTSRPRKAVALRSCWRSASSCRRSWPIIGYAYDAAPFYRLPGSPPLPLYAALSFCALGIGILAASPDGRLLRMVTADSAGGRVVRFLPAALVAGPLVFGWLTLELQRARVWDATLTLSVFVLLNTGLLALVIMAVAVSIDRAETRHRRAEHSAPRQGRTSDRRGQLGQRALVVRQTSGACSTRRRSSWPETLHVDACEILEQAGDLLILRAAAGWADREVHADLGSAAPHPLGSYTCANSVPVLVDDFGRGRALSRQHAPNA